MPGPGFSEAQSPFDAELALVSATLPEADWVGPGSIAMLLGGERLLGRVPATPFEVHDLLASGIPGVALQHLVDGVALLGESTALPAALGMSLRTFQRYKKAPENRLDPDQSSRAWVFATVLAKAVAVFGSQAEAERWLDRPATGLDRRRPLELLGTAVGCGVVQEFLGRLEFGAYT